MKYIVVACLFAFENVAGRLPLNRVPINTLEGGKPAETNDYSDLGTDDGVRLCQSIIKPLNARDLDYCRDQCSRMGLGETGISFCRANKFLTVAGCTAYKENAKCRLSVTNKPTGKPTEAPSSTPAGAPSSTPAEAPSSTQGRVKPTLAVVRDVTDFGTDEGFTTCVSKVMATDEALIPFCEQQCSLHTYGPPAEWCKAEGFPSVFRCVISSVSGCKASAESAPETDPDYNLGTPQGVQDCKDRIGGENAHFCVSECAVYGAMSGLPFCEEIGAITVLECTLAAQRMCTLKR